MEACLPSSFAEKNVPRKPGTYRVTCRAVHRPAHLEQAPCVACACRRPTGGRRRPRSARRSAPPACAASPGTSRRLSAARLRRPYRATASWTGGRQPRSSACAPGCDSNLLEPYVPQGGHSYAESAAHRSVAMSSRPALSHLPMWLDAPAAVAAGCRGGCVSPITVSVGC